MLNDPLLNGDSTIMSLYQVTSSSNGIVLNDIRMNVILPIVIQFSLLLLDGIQINFCSAEWHFAECRVAILRHLKQAKNVSLGRSTSFGRKAFDRQTFGRHRQFRKYTCRPNWRNGGIKHRVGQMSVDQMLVDQIVFDEKTWNHFLSPPRFKTAKFWSWENNFVFRSNSDSFFDSFSKKQFHRYLSIQLV